MSQVMPEVNLSSMRLPPANIVKPVTTLDLVKDGEYDRTYFRELERQGLFLDENQLKATRKTDGPILIMAGAGSGKSLCIVAKIGYLIRVKGVRPEKILVVTFTKKATQELKRRIEDIVGKSNVTICTFHSLFLKILRSNGYGKHRIIAQYREREEIIKSLAFQLEHYSIEDLLSRFALYKNKVISPDKMPPDIKQIYVEYEKVKRTEKLLDFEDILAETLRLLEGNPIILSYYQNIFQYTCIDEFQDISPVSYKVIQMLSASRNNLCAVGDWRQTIYSFCGSDVKLILGFQEKYKRAEIINLDINYRTSAEILALGNSIIKSSGNLNATWSRSQYPLISMPSSSKEEAKEIVSMIKDGIENGSRYKDFTVLYRTSTASRTIIEDFLEAQIPLVIHNLNKILYEEEMIKPVIDTLRLSLNPFNLSALLRILPVFNLNHNQALGYIKMKAGQEPKVPVLKHVLTIPGINEDDHDNIRDWITMVNGLKHESPKVAIQKLSALMGDDGTTDIMGELISAVDEFKTVSQWVSHIDRIVRQYRQIKKMSADPDADAVSFMSIHSSKGLQFRTVFLIGCAEEILPHKKAMDATLCRDTHLSIEEALEEERRLLYVAVTRAKEELYISSPQTYNNQSIEVSRFLREAFNNA